MPEIMAPSGKKKRPINKNCIILQLNSTVIKNSSFNGFQWGRFCPKGPERNYFVYQIDLLKKMVK